MDDREPRPVRADDEHAPEAIALDQNGRRFRLIVLDHEDYDFICNYDPDRERTASRADMVKVVDHIKWAVIQGRIG